MRSWAPPARPGLTGVENCIFTGSTWSWVWARRDFIDAYRWEQTSVADGTYWIHRIPDPILIVRDQSDGATAAFEPYMLLSAARSEATLSPKVDFVLLPDARPAGIKGHYFEGNEQPLADVITNGLTDLQL